MKNFFSTVVRRLITVPVCFLVVLIVMLGLSLLITLLAPTIALLAAEDRDPVLSSQIWNETAVAQILWLVGLALIPVFL